MNRVLVIVVTYNGLRWLERCLSSVTGDLYVWDNDSTDGSADFVASHFPQAHLVRSAENLGFSRPNNLGMQYAIEKGYDYVYLLNQDAWLEPGALEKLVAVADGHPEYGVLSPLQMTEGYNELDDQFSKLVPLKAGDGRSEPAMTGRVAEVREETPLAGLNVIDVKRVMAAHWLVPVRVIKEVGLFNEDLFPHWGQDDDWCQRLDFCGLKIGVVPEARAVHDRAWREEPVEKRVQRNFYTGSLLRLADPRRPLFERFLFVLLFAVVKAVKYRSLLPFKYLRKIFGQISLVREHRASVRARHKCA